MQLQSTLQIRIRIKNKFNSNLITGIFEHKEKNNTCAGSSLFKTKFSLCGKVSFMFYCL